MSWSLTRRGVLQTAAVFGGAVAASALSTPAQAGPKSRPHGVHGRLTGAQAIVESLLQHDVDCVFGIPGAQENELWDEFKARDLPYLLCTHEYSAAAMADGAARATGKPGVVCVVPGPGVTNALTGLGEALLDSAPIVAIVGDVASGEKYRPFQVHSLDTVGLLRPVCKSVLPVTDVKQIPQAIRTAFATALAGEPGPVAVVIPFQLLIEVADFRTPPLEAPVVPFDTAGFERALGILSDKKQRIGIYAGYGCMNATDQLAAVADLLQAPVATSVSGRGVISDCHPLAVGWGYGPHASQVAEKAFGTDPLHPLRSGVTTLLAIGVKFSEVSTGFYGNPKMPNVIHVDANANNLGKVVPADVAVHADAGLFLSYLLEKADCLRRPANGHQTARIKKWKWDSEQSADAIPHTKCGVDPLHLIRTLRKHLPDDGMVFTDVSASEHLAAEHFKVCQPRTYFNPVDNQSMGWSVPAAIGAQKLFPNRPIVTLTGDGCLMMSMVELSTAARENLPVKVFVLDDRAYHYMQMLQEPAYRRTTATHLAKLDYRSLAHGFGLAYSEATKPDELDGVVRGALCSTGPVLVRIATDYGDRKIRWIEAVRDRFTKELTAAQKTRFLTRIATREAGLRRRESD
jgi:acetolactate synthase I/II/III large subunit